MSKRVRINVTQRDIDRGIPFSSWSCPVALAIRRHSQLADYFVGRNYFVKGECIIDDMAIPLPEVTIRFVSDFDAGRPVKPIRFTLELPEEQQG